jgi:hypothetical protein
MSLPRITTIIDSLATILDESQKRNFLRWSVLGQYIWPNAYIGQTYQDEIDYLKIWIGERIRWLDQQFAFMVDGLEPHQGEVPAAVALLQNYPNPFNPSTVVSFQLPVASKVTLAIYDVIGREVAILVDEVVEAGKHNLTFDGSRLASGAYICRLRSSPTASEGTRAVTLTRKMMLLR